MEKLDSFCVFGGIPLNPGAEEAYTETWTRFVQDPAFLFLTGYEQWSVTQSSVPGMGFNGIAATFLGGLDPIGTVFASYFIQHITSGGSYLDKNIYPSQISDFISAIIIYLCGFVLFFKLYLNRILGKKEGGKR